MHDRDLYQQILGISAPWKVSDIRLSMADRQVLVVIGGVPEMSLTCPTCGKVCGCHDHLLRRPSGESTRG